MRQHHTFSEKKGGMVTEPRKTLITLLMLQNALKNNLCDDIKNTTKLSDLQKKKKQSLRRKDDRINTNRIPSNILTNTQKEKKQKTIHNSTIAKKKM